MVKGAGLKIRCV